MDQPLQIQHYTKDSSAAPQVNQVTGGGQAGGDKAKAARGVDTPVEPVAVKKRDPEDDPFGGAPTRSVLLMRFCYLSLSLSIYICPMFCLVSLSREREMRERQ